MAETTGVTNTPPSGSNKPAAAPNKKRQRMLLYGGIGLGGFLLLSHRGSGSASQTDPNAQLQSQSDALAAEEAAMLNPPIPGGGAPVDTGGGSYTYQGPSATTAPGVTVNVAGSSTAPAKPGATTVRKRTATRTRKKVRPKAPHKVKPHPANRRGKHPETRHKTKSGTRKKSPAEVESPRGIGAGQMVMGREFPGAIGHRMGPPRVNTDGTVTRSVMLDYGGRSETHLVHNNGERWTDRDPGASPPSRGVSAVNRGEPV